MTHRSISRSARAALASRVGLVVGCAAQRAVGPLRVHLGGTPSELARVVRDYDFCRQADPGLGRSEEIFPQCGRPGAVFGDAWVVGHYLAGRVVRIQRFERWPDPVRAEERWNQLLERHAALGAVSAAARDLIFARQRIPDGTQAWVAFEHGDELIGLYLLRTAVPTEPAILEEIVPRVPPPPAPESNPPR